MEGLWYIVSHTYKISFTETNDECVIRDKMLAGHCSVIIVTAFVISAQIGLAASNPYTYICMQLVCAITDDMSYCHGCFD